MKQKLIRQIVEEYFNLQLIRETRRREYVEARAFYYKFCKLFCKLSLQAIGESLGKNHATVLNGLNRLDGWLTYDKRLQSYYNELDRSIRKALKDIDDDYSFVSVEQLYEMKYNTLTEKYCNLITKYNFLKSRLKKYQPDIVEKEEFKIEEEGQIS
tara:strand:- start:354 stop:821 length:468 start_codon:yes stop_codon:yes gene_type:complete